MRNLISLVVCVLAGALVCFSLAPFNMWILGFVSIAVFNAALYPSTGPVQTDKLFFAKSFSYGLGLFGFAVSWVYISMTRYGGASPLLGFVMTAGFVTFLAMIFAIPLTLFHRYISLKENRWLVNIAGFSAILLIGDWLRAWVFTGFPWAYVGYAHTQGMLSGWAPIGGVLLINFILYFLSASIAQSVLNWRLFVSTNKNFKAKMKLLPLLYLAAGIGAVIAGALFTQLNWTKQFSSIKNIALIQPNIPQEYKWVKQYDAFITDRLLTLSKQAQQETDTALDIIILPEAALPGFYSESQSVFEELIRATDTAQQELTSKNLALKSANSATALKAPSLITGVLFDERERFEFYNALLAINPEADKEHELYFKQRLVPFGEYVPLEKTLRGLIDFFNLPRSYINRGPPSTEPLSLGEIKVAPSVCYEVAYPDLVARLAHRANLLVTISNDAWFGRSIAADQHYQMAAMRAVEHRKPMLRSTNTGLTGAIDYRGRSIKTLPLFEPSSLAVKVQARVGWTPFGKTGSWPIILLSIGLLTLIGIMRMRTRTRPN